MVTPRQHPLEHRIPPPVVDGLCALVMWMAAQAMPSLQWSWSMPWRGGLLAALALAGGLVAWSGLRAFQRARTTFNPLQPERVSSLVQEGIYRFTRNPMYLGMALVLLGWACWLAHPLAFACIPLALWYLQRFQIQPEERVLRARFGAMYDHYCQRVRRWL